MNEKLAEPKIENITEFSADASWEGLSGATKYKLVYRQIPLEWSEGKTLEFDSNTLKTTIEGLEPTSSYQVRLIVSTPDGERESAVANFDTLVADCTPKPAKCSVL